jgi:hypothetical protein
VTTRWTEWINKQEPYEINNQTPNDKHWRLKPIWAWLMDERKAPRASFGEDDHQARWDHWDGLLSPPSFKTGRAWVKYSKKACQKTPNQQRDREESSLPYQQPTLKDQMDFFTQQIQNFVEQSRGGISLTQSGGTNHITIIHSCQCPPDSQGKVTGLK